ncbi:RNA polymerase sigma-70 factor [Ancylomarina salipaludis]|uniref:RNA polymerase sigma-70 factor n=1 Tax=Ancylomarina salipaludis TaxID=2501299 RepID=A0A4Q1JKS3_9BACT|nr:RNA polymerase sigma-70 factor [Ancylomarina salipaludis]RXQ93948.1 RNA polymerase sigma-70 factor [Ancylomarina salipaludis]
MSVDKNFKLQIIPKNKEFFEELYRDYYSSLVQFARGILFDEDEAQDIVQEVFLDLWNKHGRTYIETTIKTYLFSCVKYKSFNRLKKLNIIDKHHEQVKEACLFAYEYDAIPDRDLQNKIRETLDSFPSQMRKVLEYHTLCDWKYQEIADELEISINTVKTHVKRGYKRFREVLGKEFYPVLMVSYFVDKLFY